MSDWGVPPTLHLVSHLAPADLKARYLAATHPVERTRWHGLWLVSEGKNGQETAHLLGRSPAWVSVLVSDYGQRGPAAVPAVQRNGVQWGGKPASLDAAGLAALQLALQGPPPTGGLWTGAKAALWIQGRTGHKTHKVTGWLYLRRAGYTKQTPRPAHPEGAGPEERLAYQKKSSR